MAPAKDTDSLPLRAPPRVPCLPGQGTLSSVERFVLVMLNINGCSPNAQRSWYVHAVGLMLTATIFGCGGGWKYGTVGMYVGSRSFTTL